MLPYWNSVLHSITYESLYWRKTTKSFKISEARMLDANRHKMESSCFWETVNKIVITFFSRSHCSLISQCGKLTQSCVKNSSNKTSRRLCHQFARHLSNITIAICSNVEQMFRAEHPFSRSIKYLKVYLQLTTLDQTKKMPSTACCWSNMAAFRL